MKRLSPGMVAAILIAFCTLTASVVISRVVFERLPHLEDEFAYLYQAKIFAGGHAWVIRSEPVKYFWQPFVIQPETSADGIQKRFGKYTPGWPLLLSLGVFAGEPWIVNAFLAMLTVALTYRLGKEIFKEAVGLAAAVLLAISPMALLLNATLMSHTSAMFMSALFVYSYWRVTKNGKRRYAWAILAGLTLGWVLATRPLTAVAIAAPVILHAFSRVLDALLEKPVWSVISQRLQTPVGVLIIGLVVRLLLNRTNVLVSLDDNLTLALILALVLEIVAAAFVWTALHKEKLDILSVAIAGLAFGWILALPGSLALLFVAFDVIALTGIILWSVLHQPRFSKVFLPLVALSIAVAPTGLLWPVFNQVWTGDWHTNVYTLLWDYDQVGFGPGHGTMPGGHSLEYGWRNARADLTVWLRDVFGFTLNPGLAAYAQENWAYGWGVGLGWIIVAAGLIAGRKHEWVWLFFEIFVAIVIAQLTYWIGSVVYGTAAYSLRYYYEATFAVCLVGGYGVVAWAEALRSKKQPDTPLPAHIPAISPDKLVAVDYLNGIHEGRMAPEAARVPSFRDRLQLAWDKLWPGYIIFVVVCAASLLGYTPARFQESAAGWPNGLFRYNEVGLDQLDAITAIRAQSSHPTQPVLIVVLSNPDPSIEDNWRDYGAAMAVTSPYLNSDIIVARVFNKDDAPALVARFPDRLPIYQIGPKLYLSADEAVADASTTNPPDTSTR